nr:zinc finger protein 438 isoform X2 [Manis javanica]
MFCCQTLVQLLKFFCRYTSMSPDPLRKQLTQKTWDSPGRTVCTGESDILSGTVHNGKGLQSKSQFRTIAPKIMPKVLTSRVLSCHSPSLSKQVTPGPSISSKPLEVPTQNYALMQVAGQEGTFSLVALPHVASAQPVQKPRLHLPGNPKVPIPRYQPLPNNKALRRKPVMSFSESGCSKPPVQTQTSLSAPDHPEPLQKPGPREQVPSPYRAPAGTGPTVLTNGDSQPPGPKDHGDPDPPVSPALSTPEEPSARQGLMKILGKSDLASKKTSRKPFPVTSEKHKEQVDLRKAVTILSPAIFGNAVQLIPSVTKGKLPILPYSRMKTTEVHNSESDVSTADVSLPELKADCDTAHPITQGLNATPKIASKTPIPEGLKQSPSESDFCPATKLDLGHEMKLHSGAAKRRGRKQKVADEILAFQGKRRKCIVNKCGVKNDPQESRDQKPGVMKKYRSIMPKPVIVMPALAPLASAAAAVLPPRTPGGLGQKDLLNNSFTPRYAGCQQDSSPCPKPSSVYRNGFPVIKKPWHRCFVCNHHFRFKQHLRDHMNTHTNRRPYSCRVCRKAYVRSSSLSTHMKLHHSENRVKKLVCCEFCAKVFGHVRVYFGHLREMHRVVINTEPPASEPQPGDMPKHRTLNARGMEGSAVERENKSSPEEDLLLNHADKVKLQIKCGCCHITAQSFAEIKFHLLYVHGEEIQDQLQEEILPGSKVAREELVKHTALCWKQHPERRKLQRLYPYNEEHRASPILKKQLSLHHQNDAEILTKKEGAQPGPSQPGEAPQGPVHPSPHIALPGAPASGFNCVLCAQMLGRKEELLLHWAQQHHCENPSQLWAILHVLSIQGLGALPSKTEPGNTGA